MVAKLRVCASCEWIFDRGVECPKCGFGSYGAYYVYGKKAYRYKECQKPWREKKISQLEISLDKEINRERERRNNYKREIFDIGACETIDSSYHNLDIGAGAVYSDNHRSGNSIYSISVLLKGTLRKSRRLL